LPLLLLCIATWMLAHPFRGIFHDANLYALQALSRLYPDSLAQDVFLRFGSQDRFTVFSPAYAVAIRLFGLDHAAALLTLVSQLALFLGGWCLARAVMPAGYALLGVGLAVAVPGDYGPGRIFTCVEPFLTPRMGAEALVLLALAAAFSGRKLWCLVLLAAAAVLHPVMAAAGAAALLAALVLPRPRSSVPLILLTGAWLLLAAFALPAGEWGRLDAGWLALASQRSPYLFLSFWQLDDWSRAAITLATLILGSFTLSCRARLLCRASALTMIGGFVLTWLACDVLHLALFTQMQPWRWQWLATLVAALTLPLILIGSWDRGGAGRATALLLAAAWIFGVSEFAIITCLAALLSLSCGQLRCREMRLIFWGSCAVLALALLWRIGSNLEFTDVHYMDATLPLWLRRAMSFAHDGFVPAALLGLSLWSSRAPRFKFLAPLLAALGVAAIAVLLPFTWTAWTEQEFPQAEIARFTAWREIIAPGAEVFWAESPLSSWVLLNRPNYISGLQTSGMIFSREAALQLQRRALALRDAVGPPTFLSWDNAGAHLSLSPEQLKGICRLAAFDYLVTTVDLGMQPAAVLNKLKLYRCAPQARAAAAAT